MERKTKIAYQSLGCERMTKCFLPSFEVDVCQNLVYRCTRCCDDGERSRHSLQCVDAVGRQCEIGVLVDGVGTHDGKKSRGARWAAKVDVSYTGAITISAGA